MKAMKNWLVVSLAILSGHIYGQGSDNYIPPSPNASALMRSVDIPVNYYTGAADVSVPLFNLGGRDISIPIGLNYNASGIKVQDVASTVGIGWNLNAGGMITRMVRGEPDGSTTACTDTSPINIISSGGCDAESDIFYFSMLGRSGKFFRNPATGLFHSMPYQDVDITVVSDIPSGYWQIIDENGYKYQFGVTTTEREQSTYYKWDVATNAYVQQDTYISTWYLSKIFSPLGVQVATFTYIGANAYEYELFNQAQLITDGTCGLTAGPVNNTNVKVRINQGKYLIAISTSLGSASFDYSSTRLDLPGGQILTSVTIRNPTPAIVKRFDLDYGYFSGYFNNTTWIQCTDNNCYRLRLQAIREDNIIKYRQFEYYEDYKMAPRNSSLVDHWGYYNGYLGKYGGLPPTDKLPKIDFDCPGHNWGWCLPRADKTPDVNAREYSLKKLIYPTGGYTQFTYSNNQFDNGTLRGGLRINEIAHYNGTNITTKSTFTYAGGEGIPLPNYYTKSGTGCISMVRTSEPFAQTSDLNGVSTGYSTVTETLIDGSKIVRQFENFSTYPDIQPTNELWTYTTLIGSYSGVNQPPYAPNTTKAWMRGLMKSISYFESGGTNPIMAETYQYLSRYTLVSVKNRVIMQNALTYPANYFVGTYWINSETVELAWKETRMYGQGVPLRTDIDYHSALRTFPIEVRNQAGAGPTQKTSFRYPQDLVSGTTFSSSDPRSLGIWALYYNHIITPIETTRWYKESSLVNFNVIGANLSTFKKHSTEPGPVPFEEYSLKLAAPLTSITNTSVGGAGNVFSYDGNYRLLSTITTDPVKGTISSVVGSSGVTQNYEWMSNNTLLSAAVINPGATNQQRTEYLHNILRGMQQEKDPNNISINYEYDLQGRLKMIKDVDNNILSRYRYHYKNNDDLSVSFTVQKNDNTNLVYFAASGSAEPGVFYKWDFGNGTVNESGLPGVSNTYSANGGTFYVTCVMAHPEFPVSYQTQTVTLLPNISIAITTAGGTSTGRSIDYCTQPLATSFQSSVAGGGTWSYQWQFDYASGTNWSPIVGATASTLTWQPATATTVDYKIRCVLSNGSGSVKYSNVMILSLWCSTSGGGGGGGGNPGGGCGTCLASDGCYCVGGVCRCN